MYKLTNAISSCGFPDGPTCVSVGTGANGLEQFLDPDGCCLLPLRCGNIAGELCERVEDGSNNNPDDDDQQEEQEPSNDEEQEEETGTDVGVDPNCGFPNGPDCISLGRGGSGGLEQFADDGCCLLPARCGNVAGELCERVAAGARRLARLRRARRGEGYYASTKQ